MHNQLQSLSGQRYESVMDFMRAVKQEGFDDEFDLSLVMRMMWSKYGELQQSIRKANSDIYLTMKAEENPLHGTILKVTLHSSIVEGANVSMDLFIRSARLAVSSNVLDEEVKPVTGSVDVSASGVYWFEAEKHFKANKHFDAVALKAFKALYRSLALCGDDVAVRLLITPLQLGWRVEYRMHGKKILVTQFEYNQQ